MRMRRGRPFLLPRHATEDTTSRVESQPFARRLHMTNDQLMESLVGGLPLFLKSEAFACSPVHVGLSKFVRFILHIVMSCTLWNAFLARE